jgi:alkaline phosphatase
LATGQKTYNSAINWSDDDKPMTGLTIAEIAKAQGKAVGAITSVPWSHATPAGLGGAHNAKRDNYDELANEMLNAPWLDVMMGAGHPGFDDNGQPINKKTSEKQWGFVGGEKTWELLTSGKHPAGWKLIESKADFDALVQDPQPPKKLLGTVQVANTLQCNRRSNVKAKEAAKEKTTETSGLAATGDKSAEPFGTPMNQNVPTLATMAKGAIHCLEGNPNGFYLMIEGGAVDWANHGNNPGRMVEEQVDFLNAVEAVIQWIETHGGWDQTLLILTADHETGMLWGPNSDKEPFQPLVDNGPGKLPGLKYHSGGHSNSLVPLKVCGADSQRFADLVRGTDETAAKIWSVPGRYVDNTDIFRVMKDAVTAKK